MNLSLFPKNEDWGTGDEALDIRLNQSLKKAADHLSLQSVFEFYSFAHSLKTRAYNPGFHVTIELVCKALLFAFSPEDFNDVLFKKMKGAHWEKERIIFEHQELLKLKNELLKSKRARYMDQIDFALARQPESERNPFIETELKRAPLDLQVKILFKEFRQFLSGDLVKESYSDPLFQALRLGRSTLFIEGFAEIWFHQDQILAIPQFQLD